MEKVENEAYGGCEVKGMLHQLLAVVCGTLMVISDGVAYGWTAPYIPYLISRDSHIETTVHEAEYLETAFLIGSLSGIPITIYLVDKIGPKKSLLFVSLLEILAWGATALADRMVYIFVARYICGICENMAFVAGPLYVAEIAESRIRGFLSSIIYVMIMLGALLVYCVGPFLPFYVAPAIAAGVSAVELATFSFMPESPHYLIRKNKLEEARRSLLFFRPHCDIDQLFKDMLDAQEKRKEEKTNVQDLVLVHSNRRATIIMIVLNVGQHLCAYTVILMNLHSILEAAGSIYMDSSTVGIIFGSLMLVAAVVACFTVDRFGRKVLLILSTVLTGICLLLIAIYFNLKDLQYDVLSISWIPVVSVMIYAGVFKIGIGLMPVVVTAEIFPTNLKTIGLTLADAMSMMGSIVGLQIYQQLRHHGIYLPFYIFAACSFAISIFTVFFIPETKGRTLEEIQTMMRCRSTMFEKKSHC